MNARLPVVALVLVAVSACGSSGTKTATKTAAKSAAPSPAAASPSAAAGAGAASPSSTPAAATGGEVTLTDAADGFSVTAPAGYEQIKDPAQVQALLKAGASASPQFAAQINAVQQVFSQGAKIVALKPGLIFADNINVLVLPGAGTSPSAIGQAYSSIVPNLTKNGAVIRSHKEIQAAGGPALEIDYTLPIAGTTVQGTQVYLIHDDKAFITTLSQGSSAGSAGVADRVVHSLRFG